MKSWARTAVSFLLATSVLLIVASAGRAQDATQSARATKATEAVSTVVAGPQQAGDADGETQTKDAQRKAIVREARREVRRALRVKDPAERAAALDGVSIPLAEQIAAAKDDPRLAAGLRTVQAQLQLALGDVDGARKTVQLQQARFKAAFGKAEFERWVSERARRSRSVCRFDLAILELSEAVRQAPKSLSAAQRSLLIGDILVQQAHPDGPYDGAIQHYARVAERYRSSYPDVADDAQLRQARTLWFNGQVPAAERLFVELAETANPSVAESARHYPELLRTRDRVISAPATAAKRTPERAAAN